MDRPRLKKRRFAVNEDRMRGEKEEKGHSRQWQQQRLVIDIRDLALPPDPATLNSLNSLSQDGCFTALHPVNPTAVLCIQ